jgi:hypothetical protein
VTPDRSNPIRAVVLLLSAGVVAGMLGVGTVTSRAQRASAAAARVESRAALPDSLGFAVRYAGVGAEGVDLIWRGRYHGELAGRVIIRMEYAGAPADRGMPVWPVTVLLLFSAVDDRGSFAAELSGSMNWRSGAMRVAGLVIDGARLGSSVEQNMELAPHGYDGASTVRFVPRLAVGAGPVAD